MTASLLFQVFLEGRKEPTRLGERHPAGQIADHKAREDNGLLHFAQDHLTRAERRNIYHRGCRVKAQKNSHKNAENAENTKKEITSGSSLFCAFWFFVAILLCFCSASSVSMW
jgi:hypothetical protein